MSICNLFKHFSCDADPAALAKYVVALVKKDKPMQELKDICIDQLEVFLSDGKIFTSFISWEVYIENKCARDLEYGKETDISWKIEPCC